MAVDIRVLLCHGQVRHVLLKFAMYVVQCKQLSLPHAGGADAAIEAAGLPVAGSTTVKRFLP